MENIFIILLGLTMLYLSSTSRLTAHINMCIVQGLLLFLICIFGISHEPWFNVAIFKSLEQNYIHLLGLVFIVLETIVVKAWVIPLFLKKVLNRTQTHRDSNANIAHFYSLVISSIILFGGFMVANIQTPIFKNISPLYVGVSAAIIITSLWLITIKHTVLSNVINFITINLKLNQ